MADKCSGQTTMFFWRGQGGGRLVTGCLKQFLFRTGNQGDPRGNTRVHCPWGPHVPTEWKGTASKKDKNCFWKCIREFNYWIALTYSIELDYRNKCLWFSKVEAIANKLKHTKNNKNKQRTRIYLRAMSLTGQGVTIGRSVYWHLRWCSAPLPSPT